LKNRYLAAEFYSRDLSIKHKSANYVKYRRGEYQSKICPYGYRKGADGRLEPDEKTAPVVRLIFELARSGRNKQVAGAHGPTAALVDKLIDRVYIHPDIQIEIAWKMEDFCAE